MVSAMGYSSPAAETLSTQLMVPTKATTPTRKDASSQIVAVDHEVAGEAAVGDVAFEDVSLEEILVGRAVLHLW